MVTAAELLAFHDQSHGGWHFLIPVLWFVLIFGAIYLVKRRGGWGHRFDTGESVLAERFARGEITEQEYRERKDVLRRKS